MEMACLAPWQSSSAHHALQGQHACVRACTCMQALANFRYRPTDMAAFKEWMAEFCRLVDRRNLDVKQVGGQVLLLARLHACPGRARLVLSCGQGMLSCTHTRHLGVQASRAHASLARGHAEGPVGASCWTTTSPGGSLVGGSAAGVAWSARSYVLQA